MERTSSSTSRHAAIAEAIVTHALAPANTTAVMWEQMQYLVGHVNSDCNAKCPDCTRLGHVRRYLMLPFAS